MVQPSCPPSCLSKNQRMRSGCGAEPPQVRRLRLVKWGRIASKPCCLGKRFQLKIIGIVSNVQKRARSSMYYLLFAGKTGRGSFQRLLNAIDKRIKLSCSCAAPPKPFHQLFLSPPLCPFPFASRSVSSLPSLPSLCFSLSCPFRSLPAGPFPFTLPFRSVPPFPSSLHRSFPFLSDLFPSPHPFHPRSIPSLRSFPFHYTGLLPILPPYYPYKPLFAVAPLLVVLAPPLSPYRHD